MRENARQEYFLKKLYDHKVFGYQRAGSGCVDIVISFAFDRKKKVYSKSYFLTIFNTRTKKKREKATRH